MASSFIVVFFLHITLQEIYHQRCRANLLTIMLYGNSDMCNVISSILDSTEMLARTCTLRYIKCIEAFSSSAYL